LQAAKQHRQLPVVGLQFTVKNLATVNGFKYQHIKGGVSFTDLPVGFTPEIS